MLVRGEGWAGEWATASGGGRGDGVVDVGLGGCGVVGMWGWADVEVLVEAMQRDVLNKARRGMWDGVADAWGRLGDVLGACFERADAPRGEGVVDV